MTIRILTVLGAIALGLAASAPALADATAECNAGASADSLECGEGASTGSQPRATAIGASAQATGAFGATAVGRAAEASGAYATAVGNSAQADDLDTAAFGNNAHATAAGATAIGTDTRASAMNAVALGDDAVASALAATALGESADATMQNATALGQNAQAVAEGAVALGAGSLADLAHTVSVGTEGGERRIVNLANGVNASDAVTMGQFGSAIAELSSAGADLAFIDITATGAGAQALGEESMAIGRAASTTSDAPYALAIGRLASAEAQQSMAIGASARATGGRATAIGFMAEAAANGIAFGQSSLAASNALAFGSRAASHASAGLALGNDALVAVGATAGTAIGAQAQAHHLRSTAIGFGSVTTATNQVMLGATGSSVALGDIAASDAAQSGPERAVTVDANGVLGFSNSATTTAVRQVRAPVDYLASVSQAQFDTLSGRVDGLSGALAETNFRLSDLDRRMSGGIAAATALGSAIAMPGKSVTIGGNIATYNGEHGYAASFTGRLSDSFAVGAGIAGNSGDGEVVAQAGFALGF
ncbi:hypothetical protein [Aurantiacibacter poecillastricola]|uniref:hypothetical protein n=1 Tax=Aurantiacibacter poecillastricola TaxID=3064385 RepID=UPI00273F6561|nr:hypothetical protein [Aurantiacibacter sp. 219JJ12-13]MDP5263084.1 hypothetical protein [Aurantiacibacter sp. 219JJ12-13]